MNKRKLFIVVLSFVLILTGLFEFIPGNVDDVKAYSSEKTLPPLTGDMKMDIIAIAKSQVGYTEDETGTVYGAWYTKQTNSSYDFTTAPWCAMFISWCANKAGIGSDIIPTTSLSKYSASVFKNNGLWKNPTGYTPQAGDLIYFVYGDSDEINHMGLVIEVNDKKVTVCEGNKTSLNGGVGISTYLLDNPSIKGYASPQYKNSTNSSASPSASVKPSATVTPSPSVKPSATVKPSASVKPSATVKPSVSVKPSATVTPSPTVKPSATAKPSEGATESSVLVYAEPTRVLKVGYKGNDVIWLQYCLNKLGNYKLKIDGVMGANTINAVKKVQANLKLTVDGVVGSATVKAIKVKLGLPTKYVVVNKSTNSVVLLGKTLELKAIQYKYNQIKLTWKKVSKATGYVVYRYNPITKKYDKYKVVTSNVFVDNKLTPNTTYAYKVAAYQKIDKAYCYGMYSSAVKCVSRPVQVVAKVKVEGSRSIRLYWTRQSDVTGYEVYRSTSASGKYSLRKDITVNTRTYFINTGLNINGKYYYKVRSYKKINGKKVYGAFSKVCYIKVVK